MLRYFFYKAILWIAFFHLAQPKSLIWQDIHGLKGVMNKHAEQPINVQNILDLGFRQVMLNTFSNGLFDLKLSDSGAVTVYVQGDNRSITSISDLQVLNSLHNYNIISAVGINSPRLN